MHGFATPKCAFAPGGCEELVTGYQPGECWGSVLHQVEVYFVLGEQAVYGRGRRGIGEHPIDQGDRAQTHHSVAAELAGVDGQKYLARIADNRLGDPHFLVVEVEQTAVFIDATDADQGEIDLELLDKIYRCLADDAAIAAHRTAGQQHFEVGLGAELGRYMQIVGDDLQALVAEQLTGNGFGGGTNVDEERGVVGDLCGNGGSDALLFIAHLPGAHAVGGVLRAGAFTGCSAMGAAQQALFRKLINVAANGLRGDGKRLGQLVDADIAAFAGEFENVVLAWRQGHENSLKVRAIIGCRADFMAYRPQRPPFGPSLRDVKNCSRQFFRLRYANFVRLFSHSNMTPAIDLLKKAKAAHQVHSYHHDPKAASYGLEAAEKLNLEPAQVFKTLLAASEKGELLVAVVPVAGTLDLKALAQAAGAKKADMADPNAAQRATGYLLGGISPLGQKKRLRTFIDESAQHFPNIYVSAGRRGLEVQLEATVLAQLTQAIFAPIGRG